MCWMNKQPYKARVRRHGIQGSERGNDLFKVTWLTRVAVGSPPRSVGGKCANSVSILRVYVGAMVCRSWLHRPGAQRPAGPGEKRNKGNTALGEEEPRCGVRMGGTPRVRSHKDLSPNLPKDKGMWLSMS